MCLVAVVTLVLGASPAAADHSLGVGDVCGVSADKNGKYLMRIKISPRNDLPTCSEDSNNDGTADAPLPDQPTNIQTLQDIYGGAPSSLTGEDLHKWCTEKMFSNAHQIPDPDTDPGTHDDGTSTTTISYWTGGTNFNTYKIDDPVLDWDALVAGEAGCSDGVF